jgi:CubicO group peptidase (beta-lactamase class C family)
MVVPFPGQPPDLAWPTESWPAGDPHADVDADRVGKAVDRLMTQPPELGITLAVAIAHRGRLFLESYAADVKPDDTFISWSTAKSVTHALAGLLVGDGVLQLDAPMAEPEWSGEGDARAEITLRNLLEMRSGLRFVEDYVDADISHCIDMLFGAGQDDVAHYAAQLPLDHSPGTHWSYSSGTTNIVSRAIGRTQNGEHGMLTFMRDRLFGPLGMTSADPRFDAAGTFIGSSFLYCTALDFLRFGYLYLRGGAWEGRPLLPDGWAEHARTPTPGVPDTEDFGYGAHWWLWRDVPGMFGAHGYEGQYILVAPDRDLVVVRLGKTPADIRPNLVAVLREIIEAFPAA